jgi:hypothetical protein
LLEKGASEGLVAFYHQSLV